MLFRSINNTDRSAGAMLSGAVAKIYGHAGLPHDTIQVSLKGTAGQAFGAWLARGITFELEPVLSEEMINEDAYHATGDLEAHGRVDVFKDLLDSDVERLHILITRHAKLTGSRRAADILANWKAWLPKFRKVMPVEYRRALKELKANADSEPKIAIGA